MSDAYDPIVEAYERARAVPLRTGEEGSGVIEVHVLDKSLSATPADDATPIVIVPGYGGGPRVVRQSAIELTGLGRSSVTFSVPLRSRASEKYAYPAHTSDVTKLHVEALLRALQEAEHIHGQKTFDAIGYSFGAVVVLTAAVVAPERFRKLLLLNPPLFVAPGGAVGRAVRLALRFRAHERQSKRIVAADAEMKAMYDDFVPASVKVVKAGGRRYTRRVLWSLARADVGALVAAVRAQGTAVAALCAQDDIVFPYKETAPLLGALSVPVFTAPGNHANAGLRPKAMAKRYLEVFNSMH